MTGLETASIEDLVRLLVEQSPRNTGNDDPSEQDPNAEEVVFDVEVQGSRYLLIRLPKPAQLDVQLSPREREIARLVARGHSNKIIAGVLNISSWTVCTHLRRIFAKLGVGSRAAMVARMPEIDRATASNTAGREGSARKDRDAERRVTPSLRYSSTHNGR